MIFSDKVKLLKVDEVIEALREAEKIKGGPVFTVDIYKTHLKMNPDVPPVPWLTLGVLYDLFRTDQVLADMELNKWTLNPELQSSEGNKTDYEVYSDRFRR